ncbi:MAG: DUF1800 domain-containing protein [Phycisphaerales bacterium]|nr:DUF1800 domain-containing protein [Phycisphaerales bacterium]MCI0629253.1 DUF1800 domain-containing protein [Phycisphaerales bacterium]
MAINSLKELNAEEFDFWKALHLLNRAGFGGTPQQVNALAAMGLDGAVDYVVDYESIDFEQVRADDFDRNIIRPATDDERREIEQARRNGDQEAVERLQRMRQQRQAEDRRQMAEIQKWWLKRMVETPRPLEEKMTLFWHGHFATAFRAVEDSYHMFMQNMFFRQHATGHFSDLVYGIIRDPAMLRFLNNDQNRKQQPNENLARELMELFTLGEGHRYTEDDIKEGARALTGYTFDDDSFVIREQMHDGGSKRILSQVGRWDGVDFCRIILAQRAVSEFICGKLYAFFVNDLGHSGGDGQRQKDARGFTLKLAKVLRDGDYALKPVLKALFKSEHFYDQANVAAVIKSPIQIIVQAIRTLHTPVRSLPSLASAADLMGQNLFFPPSVQGWNGGRTWINTSTMFVRQNLMVYLLTGRRPDAYEWDDEGREFDAEHLQEFLKSGENGQPDVRQTLEYMVRFNLGAQPHADRLQTVADFVSDRGGRLDHETMIAVLALIAAMPEYQLC